MAPCGHVQGRPEALRSLRSAVLFEPADDMGAIDESGPGQRCGIEVRVPRREVSAVIDELAEKVELAGARGGVCRCPSGGGRTDAMVDHLLDECPPPKGRCGAEQRRGGLGA